MERDNRPHPAPDSGASAPNDPAATVVAVSATPKEYDHAVDVLWTHGALAVSEEAQPDGAVLLTAGYETAHAAAQAAGSLAHLDARLLVAQPEAWVETWRRGAVAHRTGPFFVRLPEHQPSADSKLIDLQIEPGTTFGFAHATTRLALELLATLPGVGRRVADVGCGSGVLAVGAALLGAELVDAVDIDPLAVAATAGNAGRNHLGRSDSGPVGIRVLEGSADALPAPGYDHVLLNVTAATMAEVAHEVLAHLEPNGHIILSGLLVEQRDTVAALFGPLERLDERSEGEWAGMILGR